MRVVARVVDRVGVGARRARGDVELGPGVDPRGTVAELMALPGIGPWTAEYIAMRALRWPDAFPSGDLALRKAANGCTAKELAALAERWRPWRAYGAMHLWESLQVA